MGNDEGFNADNITYTTSSYTITLIFYHYISQRMIYTNDEGMIKSLQQIQYSNNTNIISTERIRQIKITV